MSPRLSTRPRGTTEPAGKETGRLPDIRGVFSKYIPLYALYIIDKWGMLFRRILTIFENLTSVYKVLGCMFFFSYFCVSWNLAETVNVNFSHLFRLSV